VQLEGQYGTGSRDTDTLHEASDSVEWFVIEYYTQLKITSIKARAPVVGGNFAVWSGMFNAGDCLLAGLRGKEDHWNAIMSGAVNN